MSRVSQIQILRGPVANVPVLNDGEFFFATDKGQLYVGLGGLNFPVGAPVVANVSVQGSLNPTRFIEPNVDGSVNATLVSGGSVSIGSSTGKTAVLKTGQLTTTAVTVNQVILTYTVTVAKTLYLEYFDISSRLTVPAATASVLGTAILQIAGVTSYTGTFINPTTSDCGSQSVRLMFTEPIPIAAGTVIAILTTPAAVTSMLWTGNFGGYEK